MKLLFRAAMLSAAIVTAACTAPAERVCPALPEIEFSPDTTKGYGVKDELKATIAPYAVEDGHKFACPAKVCFTLDGTEPQQGRASTYCYNAPVKDIPIRQSTCIKYFVVGADGSQSTTQEACYRVEPPPVSYCDPKPKASREPINVRLVSSKAGSIYYTLDGSDPDPENADGMTSKAASTSAQVKIDDEGTTTLKFRAEDKDGNLEEQVNTCEFKYDATPPETTADPLGKASATALQVNLSASELARIYYTTDGSDPDPTRLEDAGLGSTRVGYSDATINADHSLTLRYYSVDYVGNEEAVQSQNYFVAGKPIVNVEPGPGPYVETSLPITLSIITALPGDQPSAEIWYTIDNSTPERNGGTSRLYSAPITDFNKEGEYTLKYIGYAKPGQGGQVASNVFTATFILGSTGRPFYKEIDFTDAALYNEAASSRSVEHNTRKGFVRLRHKIPQRVGAGVDSLTTANPFDFPQEAAIFGNSLILATGNELRVYALEQYSPSGTKLVPEDNMGIFFDFCSTTRANGALLGVNVFARTYPEATTVYAVTPWTNRNAFNNCGGFVKWRLNYSTASVREYVRANLTQFAGPQEDPWLTDFEEVNEVSDPNFPNLPKTASEVIDGFADDVMYYPRYRTNNYYVDGYFTSNGAQAITSATIITGRPSTMKANPVGAWLAVGDTAGKVYVLNAANLDKLGEAAIPCPAGERCRVNGVAWYIDGFDVYLLAAVGRYGGAAGGKIAILSVNGSGALTLVSDDALPDTDPFLINATVEGVAMLPDGEHAAVALRNQGVVVLDLSDAANGKVAALGHVNAGDIGDNAFWANDITPYPGTSQNRAVVLDVGRTNQALDAGFQIFDFSNAGKWETTGHFVSTNLNDSGKPISRVRLVAAVPNPLPLGLQIKLITDGVEVAEPIAIDTELAFPAQPSDVRMKITFASADTGATTVFLDFLRFKFTPVE